MLDNNNQESKRNIISWLKVSGWVLLILPWFPSFAQAVYSGSEIIIYKKVDTVSLGMDVYYPSSLDTTQLYPGAVFFYGGGWKSGTIKQFEQHAKYFASRGLVCFLVDYRVEERHNTTPFESLKDAKSAIRFIKQNAKRFSINKDKIVGIGGSAGGHLAAATAMVDEFNESTDNLSVNPKPDALILFNPVIDNSPAGYGFERIGAGYKDFSPLHNITNGAPPTIIFLGTNDDFIPVETAVYFKTAMERVGSRCDLYLYEGQKHGFFNYANTEYYKRTIRQADKFLISLNFLEDEPTIMKKNIHE